MAIEETKTLIVSSAKLKIDLHSHTTASDGELSPTELVMRAANMQVTALAITDHDTVGGLAEAEQAIAKHNLAVQLVHGIELSTCWQNMGIHVVGLNIDCTSAVFLDGVNKQHQIRLARAKEIAHKLEKTGFGDIFSQAQSLAKGGEITRAHFARALVMHHGVSSMNDAFKRFMGKGKAGDVKAQWPDMAATISLIQQAKGQAVLAHPLKYDLSTKWIRRLISAFAEYGGDAIEVAGPGVTGDKQKLLHDIVAQAGLKASVGSDFHSPGRWTELGRFQQVLAPLTPVWHDWPVRNVS